MEILLYIGCATVGTFLGCIIAKGMQSNCKHKWLLFKNTTINNFRYGKEVQVGYVKFYECEHCKKMKKEKVEIN
jgi:hypothetical protein